jgi:hypothetical protein
MLFIYSKLNQNFLFISLMIKKMPQYQKELNAYALHFNIAEQCMNTYNRDLGEKLCSVEQVI